MMRFFPAAAAAITLASAASAQPGPDTEAMLSLSDGRTVIAEIVSASGDYWLGIDGSEGQATGRGGVADMYEMDFDYDGVPDVVVDSGNGVTAFDVSTSRPYLITPFCDDQLDICRTIRRGAGSSDQHRLREQFEAFQQHWAETGESATASVRGIGAGGYVDTSIAFFDASVRAERTALALAEYRALAGEIDETQVLGQRMRLEQWLAARAEFVSGLRYHYDDRHETGGEVH